MNNGLVIGRLSEVSGRATMVLPGGTSRVYGRQDVCHYGLAIRHLYVSPGHNFVGHHGRAAGRNPITEVTEIECVAGRGIRGDRFFDYRKDYKGQITFFAIEVYASICEALGVFDKPPSVFRRNVITEGMDLNAVVGKEFVIQGIRFRGTEECKPCYWMDQAFGPGTEEFLRGHGGLRAAILNDGKLGSEAAILGFREKVT